MNKRLFLSLYVVIASGLSHAGSYSVKRYDTTKINTQKNSVDQNLYVQLSRQMGQSSSPNLVYEQEPQIQVAAPESKPSQQHKQEETTSPFAWMSQVGRNNQYNQREIETIVANIQAEKNRTQQNNYRVQNASFMSPNSFIPVPSSSLNRNSYDQIIAYAANKHGVSVGLVKAIMHTESGFNPNARSPVGAQGLMQLMPATAKRFNVSNAYDPHQNIEGGVRYLSWLIKRFNGNLKLALAGYNAGEGNVDKYGGIPPFRETRDYVERVLTRYHNLYRGL